MVPVHRSVAPFAAIALVIGLFHASPSSAATPPPQLANSIDVAARAHLRIMPNQPNVSPTVAAAGDVNGDGFGDLVVGVSPGPGCRDRGGAAYVVFGSREPATVALGALGSRGFAIRGTGEDGLGAAVDGAGDVNGDGLADVVVGAPVEGLEAGGSLSVRGAAYVIFGSRSTEAVDVVALGERGYKILGRQQPSFCPLGAGAGVAGLGDLNGDGRDDVLVTTSPRYPTSPSPSTAAVVFGHAGGNVATEDLGEAGYEVRAIMDAVFDSAGDFNGDGRGDVAVGEPSFSPPGTCEAGRASVLFGKADAAPVSAGEPGAGALVVRSAFPGRFGKLDCSGGERLGFSVAPAGDLNGDGLGEVILGASTGALVLHGRTAGTQDTAPGAASLSRLSGLGAPVGVGDVDGDGRPDIVAGARTILPAAAVILGEAAFAGAVTPPGPIGWLLRTDFPRPTGAGDVNGDGRSDVAFVEDRYSATPRPREILVVAEGRPNLAAGRCANLTSGTDRRDEAAGSDAGDRILGFGGADAFNGFGGEDCLLGGSGSDSLDGGDGGDRLEGGDDPDVLRSGAGADALFAGRGRDRVYGGSGDDLIDAADGAVDSGDCGPGVDRLRGDVFDRFRGCERRRLLAGRPRQCVTPRVTARALAVRTGEPVGLGLSIDAPSPVRGFILAIDWRFAASAAGGRSGIDQQGLGRRRGRSFLRRTIGVAGPGRFTVRVAASYVAPSACGDQREYISPSTLVIRVPRTDGGSR